MGISSLVIDIVVCVLIVGRFRMSRLLTVAITAIARCRPAGALHNPFLPEFTEYIVYANLDSQEEAAHNPIVKEPFRGQDL